MHSGLSYQQITELWLLAGALLVYIEFLRPGWIVPAVIGASLLTVGTTRLIAIPPPWSATTAALAAAACFVVSCRICHRAVPIALGSGLTAIAAVAEDRIIGMVVGVPFAALTGYLVNMAIRARRNKHEFA